MYVKITYSITLSIDGTVPEEVTDAIDRAIPAALEPFRLDGTLGYAVYNEGSEVLED